MERKKWSEQMCVSAHEREREEGGERQNEEWKRDKYETMTFKFVGGNYLVECNFKIQDQIKNHDSKYKDLSHEQ